MRVLTIITKTFVQFGGDKLNTINGKGTKGTVTGRVGLPAQAIIEFNKDINGFEVSCPENLNFRPFVVPMENIQQWYPDLTTPASPVAVGMRK